MSPSLGEITIFIIATLWVCAETATLPRGFHSSRDSLLTRKSFTRNGWNFDHNNNRKTNHNNGNKNHDASSTNYMNYFYYHNDDGHWQKRLISKLRHRAPILQDLSVWFGQGNEALTSGNVTHPFHSSLPVRGGEESNDARVLYGEGGASQSTVTGNQGDKRRSSEDQRTVKPKATSHDYSESRGNSGPGGKTQDSKKIHESSHLSEFVKQVDPRLHPENVHDPASEHMTKNIFKTGKDFSVLQGQNSHNASIGTILGGISGSESGSFDDVSVYAHENDHLMPRPHNTTPSIQFHLASSLEPDSTTPKGDSRSRAHQAPSFRPASEVVFSKHIAVQATRSVEKVAAVTANVTFDQRSIPTNNAFSQRTIPKQKVVTSLTASETCMPGQEPPTVNSVLSHNTTAEDTIFNPEVTRVNISSQRTTSSANIVSQETSPVNMFSQRTNPLTNIFGMGMSSLNHILNQHTAPENNIFDQRTTPTTNVFGEGATQGIFNPTQNPTPRRRIFTVRRTRTAVTPSNTSSSSDQCQPPPGVSELFRRLNGHLSNATLFALGTLGQLQGALGDSRSPEAGPHDLQYCPPSGRPDSGPEDELRTRSLCPWYYERVDMPEHYPSALLQARCCRQRCSLLPASSTASCTTVHTHIILLRRTGCVAGFWALQRVRVLLYVGCTCALHPTVVNGSAVV